VYNVHAVTESNADQNSHNTNQLSKDTAAVRSINHKVSKEK